MPEYFFLTIRGLKIILPLFLLNSEISFGITSTLYLYSGSVFLPDNTGGGGGGGEFVVIGCNLVSGICSFSNSNSFFLLFCFCLVRNNSSLIGTILNVALSTSSDGDVVFSRHWKFDKLSIDDFAIKRQT